MNELLQTLCDENLELPYACKHLSAASDWEEIVGHILRDGLILAEFTRANVQDDEGTGRISNPGSLLKSLKTKFRVQ